MPSLSATLSRSAATTRDPLFIEQEKYGATDGYLSRAGLYLGIMALLDGDPPADPVCVDACGTTLHVYRYDLNVHYRLAVSHGALGEMVRSDDLLFTEKIVFVMADTAGLSYPCHGLVESLWLGDVVYDQDGGEIAPPAMTASLDALALAAKVYGTLAVTYRTSRDSYALELPARDQVIENKYSSVAYALWNGGLTWLTVTPPPGAEESDQQCSGGWGASLHGVPPDAPEQPYGPNADAEILIDYCSQEVISDTSQ